MKRMYQALLAAALLWSCGLQAAVSVDSVNYPAWVKRGDLLEPLAPGNPLETGDEVRTGASGRAWLALDDGSVVKLGNNARFVIERAGFDETASDSVFDAVFDVLAGAFRFTSGFFTPKRRAIHRVDFTVGAITAGIRGTDIWGRSADDQDFVALLEGRIEVSADDAAPLLLEEPLSLYAKPAGQPASSSTVDAATVARLAPETELDADAGIASTIGSQALVLMSLSSETFVDASLARFRQAGYPVVSQAAGIDGVMTTRLLLPGIVDRAAAESLRQRLAREFSIDDIWITAGP